MCVRSLRTKGIANSSGSERFSQSGDSLFSIVILPGDANPSGSCIRILLVGVAVFAETMSFFDKRFLMKTQSHNHADQNKQPRNSSDARTQTDEKSG